MLYAVVFLTAASNRLRRVHPGTLDGSMHPPQAMQANARPFCHLPATWYTARRCTAFKTSAGGTGSTLHWLYCLLWPGSCTVIHAGIHMPWAEANQTSHGPRMTTSKCLHSSMPLRLGLTPTCHQCAAIHLCFSTYTQDCTTQGNRHTTQHCTTGTSTFVRKPHQMLQNWPPPAAAPSHNHDSIHFQKCRKANPAGHLTGQAPVCTKQQAVYAPTHQLFGEQCLSVAALCMFITLSTTASVQGCTLSVGAPGVRSQFDYQPLCSLLPLLSRWSVQPSHTECVCC